MRRRRAVSSIVLLGLLFVGGDALRLVASADVPSRSLGRWAGAFAYAGDAREREARRRSIERATADMGVLSRHIARNRLERAMRPDPRIVVRVEGSVVGIGAEGSWATVLDGPARTFAEDGDRYRVRHLRAGLGIVQIIEDDSMQIRKAYALSPDGAQMRVTVTFAHERLPAPLRFVLTYRRVR
jgi:hypothetical protein